MGCIVGTTDGRYDGKPDGAIECMLLLLLLV